MKVKSAPRDFADSNCESEISIPMTRNFNALAYWIALQHSLACGHTGDVRLILPRWPNPPHPMIAIQSPSWSPHFFTEWYATKLSDSVSCYIDKKKGRREFANLLFPHRTKVL